MSNNSNATSSRVYVHFTIIDLNNYPLENEPVFLNIVDDSLVYTANSNEFGIAGFLLPKGKKYIVNLKYEKDIDILDYPYTPSLHRTEISYKYMGSENIEQKQKEIEKVRKKNEEHYKKQLEEYASGEYAFSDSTVLKTLDRNSHWKNKLVVTDLTGSMYPFAGQVLPWYKINYMKEDRVELFFFNDGDSTPDRLKKIGKTGGIYVCENCNYDNLFRTMLSVMIGGNGGDTPENNMEAILFAVSKIKTFDELILIADNYASVKDIGLLDELNIPVRIVLCGVNNSILPDYLQIAYKTGGSVHAIE